MSAAEQGNADVVAIVGATIIDGNGGTPIRDGVILIEKKRVVAVGDRAVPIPSHAKRVGATGKFVIPGLMGPHHYLVDGAWPPGILLCEGRYDEVAVEGAQLALKGGVTTVFDSWGPRDPLIKARNAINEGRVTAARIYLCGNWIGLGGPFSDDMRPHFKEAMGGAFVTRTNALWEANIGEQLTRMSLEEVRQEVRKYVQSGIDFVSYPVNCHRHGAYQYLVFSPRVQRMIVEEGHRAGLPVQAIFATTEEGIHLAIEVGADLIVAIPWGGRPTSAETLELIAQREIPVFFVVTPAEDLEWARQRHPSDFSPDFVKFMESSDLDVRALIKAGALRISAAYSGLLSADQLNTWGGANAPGHFGKIGEGHVRYLQALQQKGMAPMDVLMSATRNVARAFKVDRDLGTLDRGKFADVVILNSNPLENPQSYLDIHLVMKEGKVINRDALPTQRLWTAPLAQST